LGNRLVDDGGAEFREPIDVFLAGSVVTTFLGVVEQSPGRITIVAIVLRGVDTTLSGDTVSSAGRILEAEAVDVVAHRSHGSRRRGTGQAATNDDDFVLRSVLGANEPQVVFVVRPGVLDWPGRNF